MSETYEKKGYLLEDFRLFHIQDQGQNKIDSHYHEFHKILFLISGGGGYFIAGKRYALAPGDLVLIGKHEIHRPDFTPNVKNERIILYISPEFLEATSSSSCRLSQCFTKECDHVLRPDEKRRKFLHSILSDVERELSADRFGSEILSSSMLLHLLVEIARNLFDQKIQKPSPVLPKSKCMQELLTYLDTHLTEDLTIEKLAEKFYISRFHMMRRFREETGTTIHAYLSEHRLLLARDLIENGSPATQVCFQCGFGSYSSFSRAYTKFFGTTPTGRTQIAHIIEPTYE